MRDVFISGWCGYPELFGDFAAEFEFIVPFVTHSLQDIEDILQAGGRNLFAWSTGAYIVLSQRERPAFDNIVLAAPFMKFTRYTPERVLEKMTYRFAEFPDKVAEDFYLRAGCPSRPALNEKHFHINLNGLRFLMRSDIEEIEWSLEGVRVLHGLDDVIVNVEAARDIAWVSDCALTELERTGHFIPPEILRRYKI